MSVSLFRRAAEPGARCLEDLLRDAHRHRAGGQHVDAPGTLVGSQPGPDHAISSSSAHVGTRAQFDDADRDFPFLGMGHAERGGTRHGGMRSQHVFDVAREDRVAAALDDILRPSDQADEPAPVADAEVAGPQPAVRRDQSPGGRRVLPVAGRQAGPLHHALADLPTRRALAGLEKRRHPEGRHGKMPICRRLGSGASGCRAWRCRPVRPSRTRRAAAVRRAGRPAGGPARRSPASARARRRQVIAGRQPHPHARQPSRIRPGVDDLRQHGRNTDDRRDPVRAIASTASSASNRLRQYPGTPASMP